MNKYSKLELFIGLKKLLKKKKNGINKMKFGQQKHLWQ